MINAINGPCKWLLSITVFLLAGCAGMHGPVQEPEVTLADMRILEVKPFEAVVQLSLRVMNPNDFGLNVNGVRCDLKIDGKHFATGIGDQHSEIPAFGTGLVPVTVYASTLKMFSRVLAMIQGMDGQQSGLAPIRYELTGKIRLGGGLNRFVPFHSKGELALNAPG
jgi:LEA14-like dessication related protein